MSVSAAGIKAKVMSVIKGDVREKVVKPVFVVGCGRSGTTMLFNLLTAHPDLVRTTGYPDGEDHVGWIQHGKCLMAGIGSVKNSQYGSGINGHNVCAHMTENDLTPEIVENMYGYYWKEVLGKKRGRVINKQPHLSNKLGYLLGIFPDAKVIHIIRDCKPMVASWLVMMEKHPNLSVYLPEEEIPCLWLFPQPEDPTMRACLERDGRFSPGAGETLWIDYWNKINMGIEKQMADAGKLDQLCSLRYEDLVENPAAMLGKLLEFCELPAFEFETGHVEKNRKSMHSSRISPSLDDAIGTGAREVRGHFGYEATPAGQSGARRLLGF